MTDGISRAHIVEAALTLLADGGLHALGMRRIAAQLGIQQSALYWHFDNKQELLGAVADDVVGGVTDPCSGAWDARVVTLADGLRRAVLRYPDGAELVATAIAFRLGGARPTQQFVAELERAGLDAPTAEAAASVMVHFVLGFASDEQQHRQAAALGAIPHSDPASASAGDERFARGLHLIVAGIAASRVS